MKEINVPRVAVFSLAYAPFEGGAEIACREIIARIPDYHYTIFTNRFDSLWTTREKLENGDIVRLGKGKPGARYGRPMQKALYVFRAWRAAESMHRAHPFVFIWGIMASYGGVAALLFKLRHPTVPFLLTLQEGDSEEHILRRVGIFYFFWKRIFKEADAIQAISNHLAAFACKHGATCRVEVVGNGIDLNNIKNKISKRKNKYQKEKTIITTSRLVKKNGIDILIQAFARLTNSSTHKLKIHLLIVGGGPEESNLKNLAQELGVADRVDFLGQVPADDIPALLADADLFVRPSRSEGLGNSFLEAMVAGLPVVGTNVGGIPDIINNNENGILIATESVEECVEAMRKILEDESLARRLADSGKKFAQNFDWSLIAEKMKRIFTHIFARQNILILTGIYPPEIGGPAQYAVSLGQALEKKGYKVCVRSFSRLRKLPTGLRHLMYFFWILPALGRADFAIALDTFSVALPGVCAAKLLRKKIIIRVGGDFLWEQYVERTGESALLRTFYETRVMRLSRKESFILTLTRFALRHADRIVFNTAWQKKIWMEPYAIDEARTHIIENCYGAVGPAIAPAQKNFICFTRNLVWKNIDTLSRAFQIAEKRASGISLVTGSLSRDQYLEKLRNCYAVILVSLGDIGPNMILEAISAGKPFILSEENGLENRIGSIGFRVDPQNVDAIADVIVRLASESEYRKEEEKIHKFSFTHSYDEIATEFLTVSKLSQ